MITSLDQASQRLSQAFLLLEERLEASCPQAQIAAEKVRLKESLTQDYQHRMDTAKAENLALQSEKDELTSDNEILRNELHALKQDYVELQNLNERIAMQIDEQVSQLELMAS